MGTLEENINKCLHCENPIFNKRHGAIYCSVKCGYTYRNNKKRIQNKHQNKIIKIIKSNDEILRQLCARNKTIISSEELKTLGFDFEHHTKLVLKDKKMVGTEFFIYKVMWANNDNYKIEMK